MRPRGPGLAQREQTRHRTPSSTRLSSAARQHESRDSADVSVGREHPPCVWPGACDHTFVSPRVPWAEIALPSVVVAEVLRGRCEFALNATPAEAPLAHQRLLDTPQMLAQFRIVVFDVACATIMERLRQQHRRRKRYADVMIAAMVLAGQHMLVTRNRTDFVDVLPARIIAKRPLREFWEQPAYRARKNRSKPGIARGATPPGASRPTPRRTTVAQYLPSRARGL